MKPGHGVVAVACVAWGVGCPLYIPATASVDVPAGPVFSSTLQQPGDFVVYSCGADPCERVHEVNGGQFRRLNNFPDIPPNAREVWRIQAVGGPQAVECNGSYGLPAQLTYGAIPDAGPSFAGADAGVADGGVPRASTLNFVTRHPPETLNPGEHYGAAFGTWTLCAPLFIISYRVARVDFETAVTVFPPDAGGP